MIDKTRIDQLKHILRTQDSAESYKDALIARMLRAVATGQVKVVREGEGLPDPSTGKINPAQLQRDLQQAIAELRAESVPENSTNLLHGTPSSDEDDTPAAAEDANCDTLHSESESQSRSDVRAFSNNAEEQRERKNKGGRPKDPTLATLEAFICKHPEIRKPADLSSAFNQAYENKKRKGGKTYTKVTPKQVRDRLYEMKKRQDSQTQS